MKLVQRLYYCLYPGDHQIYYYLSQCSRYPGDHQIHYCRKKYSVKLSLENLYQSTQLTLRLCARAKTAALIISTVKAVVNQQPYFFDMLWKKAIPATQRIKEIEQGLKREFMETIRDPYETQKILENLIKSAIDETNTSIQNN